MHLKVTQDQKNFDQNQAEEYAQRCAWRLVRSAEDRYRGPKRGFERLSWAVKQLQAETEIKADQAEDFIRAAYIHFSVETSTLK